MKIILTGKGYDEDMFYFTQPLHDLSYIKNILLFRDKIGIKAPKVNYIVPNFGAGPLRILERFLQMFFRTGKNIRILIGIYEVPHGLLAYLVGKLRGIPSVVSIISNPTYDKIRKGLRKKIMLFLARNADMITCTGSVSRAYFIDQGIKANRITILPNSIDTNFFKPIECAKKYDLITLGRLSPEKHVDNFVHIVNEICKKKSDVRAAIAGKGPQLREIEKLIASLHLNDNIDLLGFVDEKDLPKFLNSGRVFIISSETEGFPRTVIESMACGVPCVASNVGDMVDLVKNNINGYLIQDFSDISAFTEKAFLLLNDYELYKKISINSIEWAYNGYSHEVASKTWDSIFNRLNILD